MGFQRGADGWIKTVAADGVDPVGEVRRVKSGEVFRGPGAGNDPGAFMQQTAAVELIKGGEELALRQIPVRTEDDQTDRQGHDLHAETAAPAERFLTFHQSCSRFSYCGQSSMGPTSLSCREQ